VIFVCFPHNPPALTDFICMDGTCMKPQFIFPLCSASSPGIVADTIRWLKDLRFVYLICADRKRSKQWDITRARLKASPWGCFAFQVYKFCHPGSWCTGSRAPPDQIYQRFRWWGGDKITRLPAWLTLVRHRNLHSKAEISETARFSQLKPLWRKKQELTMDVYKSESYLELLVRSRMS